MAIKNIVGPPVIGDDFFGREKELEYAIEMITAGHSLRLSAPRRVGKSSFAKKILQKLEKEGWCIIEIDLQEVKTEEGFVKHFIECLEKLTWWRKLRTGTAQTIKQIMTSLKPTVRYDEIEVSLQWQAQKADVYEKLQGLLDHEKKTIIMIDELTILLYSMVKKDGNNTGAEFFLNWLRNFRQKTGTQIRWIFCSSIGIENFTSQHGLSNSINDVPPFPIGEFKENQPSEFIRVLFHALKIPYKDEYAAYILEKIGWPLPYFIQIIINKVHIKIKVEGKEMNIALIDEAYNMLISEKDFNTWDERLVFYADLEDAARRMLSKLAANPTGESRNSLEALFALHITDEVERNKLIARTLTLLQNDGYLSENGEKHFFRSPLIRDFWHHRFNK